MSARVDWELGSDFGADEEPNVKVDVTQTDAGLGGQTIGNAFLQSDNMKAIRQYFSDTPAINAAAGKIKDAFIIWYDGLSWYAMNLDSGTYDHARNERNKFNLANAPNAAARADVLDVMKTGLSTEQLEGQPRRNLESGMLPEPTKPLVPTWVWIAGAVVLGGSVLMAAHGAGEGVAKKLL